MSEKPVIELVKEGLSYHQRGALDEAEVLYQKALERESTNPDALHFLGLIFQARGDLGMAEDNLALTCGMRPDNFRFHFNYARFLEEVGRIEEAIQRYQAVLSLKPDFALAHNNLGTVLKNLDRDQEAEEAFRKALEWEPGLAMAWNNLGNVLQDLGDPDAALDAFAQALEHDPALPQAHRNRMSLLEEMGRPEAGLDAANEAASVLAGQAPFHTLRGNLLKQLGRLDEATTEIRRALEADPEFTGAYANLVPLMPRGEGSSFPELETMEALYCRPGLGDLGRANLAFGLGDHFDRTGEPERAFPFWMEGNQLVRKGKELDVQAVQREFQAWRDSFPAEVWDDFDRVGYPSEVPVFVVGMPRSGTTLVEQILSSHSRVAGAGEAGLLSGLVRKEIAHQEGGLDSERWNEWLTAEKAFRMGELYVQKMQRLAPEAERITNKSPGNFRLLGLIRAILPNARIIHCRRHPLDTCLSMFSKNFRASVDYSFDLEELGSQYRAYEGLMAHWRESLPPNTMLEISYEELVGNPEEMVRHLLDFCGLDWEEACLRFFENRRPVATASQTQVRQPIYRTSVERWRPYASFLHPLARAMGREALLEGAGPFRGFSQVAFSQIGHGGFTEAEANLRRAIEWEGECAEVRHGLARALEGQLRFDESAVEYRRAQELGLAESALDCLRVLRREGHEDEHARFLGEVLAEVGGLPGTSLEEGFWAHRAGEPGRAREIFEGLLPQYSDWSEAHYGLALIDAAQGWPEEAERELRAFRDRHEGQLAPGLALLRFLSDQGRSPEAVTEGFGLLELDPRNAEIRMHLGRALLEEDRPEEAEQILRPAVERNPRTGVLHGLLGGALLKQGRLDEAGFALEEALSFGPRSGEVLLLKAQTLTQQGVPDEGLPLLEEGLDRDPSSEGLWLGYLSTLERLNRMSEVGEGLEQIWERVQDHPQARFLAARLARRNGRPKEGLALLRELAESQPHRLHPRHWGELGQLYDRVGDADAAFSAFTRAQEGYASQRRVRRVAKEAYWAKLDRLRTNFVPDWVASWSSLPEPAPGPRAPVFLVGFPRSGTTLTEHVLRAHPRIEVVEERPTLEPLRLWLEERHGGDLKGLRDMTFEDRAHLRELYWETVAEYLEDPEIPVVVDKHPLRCTEAGMIHRIFPEARFLFLRRHPCDCVLSAYSQLFSANEAMASFHRLEDAAELYDRAIGLWERYRELFPLAVCEVFYERLVEDFEPTVAAMLDFLGLEWDARVAESSQRMPGEGQIVRTPSYAQVSQPLYAHARYRWQRYRAYLEPVMDRLLPYIRAAGYPE